MDGLLARPIAASMLVIGLAGCTPTTIGATPTPTPTLEVTPLPTATPEAGVTDLGPREGAMGAVELTSEGEPLRYTVVEGDTADAIRARFDLWWDQLSRDGVRLPKYPVIYPGDVLRFIAHDPSNELDAQP